VEVLLNTRLTTATADSVKLSDSTVISTHTLIWAGGVTPDPLIANLSWCDHHKDGRIIVNSYLEVHGYPGIFALGDCAYIVDPNTGKPCPPTAQHAIREGKVAAKNLVSVIRSGKKQEGAGGGEDKEAMGKDEKDKKNMMISFNYKTKGMMAEIGKRTGVGDLLGLKIHGFIAWWIWRTYYLANLPTVEKKLRVTVDWTLDLFFKRDVSRLKTFAEEKEEDQKVFAASINRTEEEKEFLQ
jgi:NADH dehydrogenase